MPELPTIGEIYPGYEVLIWHGLFVPAGVPQPIMDRLRAETLEVLKQPDVIKRLGTSGSGEPYFTSPEEFTGTHPRRQREIRQGDPGDRRQAGVMLARRMPTARPVPAA